MLLRRVSKAKRLEAQFNKVKKATISFSVWRRETILHQQKFSSIKVCHLALATPSLCEYKRKRELFTRRRLENTKMYPGFLQDSIYPNRNNLI